jgi:hypothetical protein
MVLKLWSRNCRAQTEMIQFLQGRARSAWAESRFFFLIPANSKSRFPSPVFRIPFLPSRARSAGLAPELRHRQTHGLREFIYKIHQTPMLVLYLTFKHNHPGPGVGFKTDTWLVYNRPTLIYASQNLCPEHEHEHDILSCQS